MTLPPLKQPNLIAGHIGLPVVLEVTVMLVTFDCQSHKVC
ncbi:hypothetical protein VAA_01986 [Vibrio anguillarum 775]|nr:hypothetical protein VAA_01986 [Vibrio anguillarum 775]ARV25654.1 hypothetical protein A6A12_1045 [Vibrio anguillarum]